MRHNRYFPLWFVKYALALNRVKTKNFTEAWQIIFDFGRWMIKNDETGIRTKEDIEFYASDPTTWLGKQVKAALPFALTVLLIGFAVTAIPPVWYVHEYIISSRPVSSTVAPTQRFSGAEFLDSFEYFSPDEADQLLQQTNVVNIAVLGGGYGTRYMRSQAVTLNTGDWNKSDSFGFTVLRVSGSFVTIAYENRTFILNTYQGFLMAHRPDRIYVVDKEGTVWSHIATPEFFVPLGKAIEALPNQLPINTSLPRTYR